MEEWIEQAKNKYNITQIKKNDAEKFADAEAKSLLDKIKREKLNKVKIWEKNGRISIFNNEISNQKTISSIKKLSKTNEKNEENEENEVNSVDYKERKAYKSILESKFFTSNEKNLYENAMRIYEIYNNKDDFQKGKSSQKKKFEVKPNNKTPIYEYINLNKKIWLKNVLLMILNNERQEITNKESRLSKALDQGNSKLERDVDRFNLFCDNQKRKIMKGEEDLHELIEINKGLLEKKRDFIHEQKAINDELEKVIKQIMISKSYAIFVCYSIGSKEIITKSFNTKGFDFNTFEFFDVNSKEKSVSKQVASLYYETSKYNYGEALKDKAFSNPDALLIRFNFLEERILNQTKENEDLKMVFLKMRKEREGYEKEILYKIEKMKSDLDLLVNEKKVIDEEVSELSRKYSMKISKSLIEKGNPKSNTVNTVNTVSMRKEEEMLYELYYMIERMMKGMYKSYKNTHQSGVVSGIGVSNLSQSPKKSQFNPVKNEKISVKSVNNLISLFENKVFSLISTVFIYQSMLLVNFDLILNKRKEFNKKMNFDEGQVLIKKKNEEKLKKAKEREKRIVLKGKKYSKRYLINEKKVSEGMNKVNVLDEENCLLYY